MYRTHSYEINHNVIYYNIAYYNTIQYNAIYHTKRGCLVSYVLGGFTSHPKVSGVRPAAVRSARLGGVESMCIYIYIHIILITIIIIIIIINISIISSIIMIVVVIISIVVTIHTNHSDYNGSGPTEAGVDARGGCT